MPPYWSPGVQATSDSAGPPATRTIIRRNPTDPYWWALPYWVHPELVYWYPEWKLIRDAVWGEKVVKLEAQLYLPPLEDMSREEYNAYLKRATFYNFTARTVQALVGTLFRRRPLIEDVPKEHVDALNSITRTGQSVHTLMKGAAHELLTINRVGHLLDLPEEPSTQPKPFIVEYAPENIMYWEHHEIDGRLRLTRVVLRELKLGLPGAVNDGGGIPDRTDRTYTQIRRYFVRYRELSLEHRPDPDVPSSTRLTYVQRIFEKENGDAIYGVVNTDGSLPPVPPGTPDPSGASAFTNATADAVPTSWVEIVPQLRGKPLDFIPFLITSTHGTDGDIARPTMGDIARLNMSHYRSYAHLEHGRFFTGFPIYYIELGAQGESSDYRIGASRVWESPMGSRPGILEFHGNGLKFLQDALDTKENQAASLGGRMIGVRGQGTGESNNQTKIKERNEQAILLDVASSLDETFSVLLQWWLQFRGVDKDTANKCTVTFSKDFLFDEAGAREFRAIQSMYADGLLPVEVLYEYMRKANVIPDWMPVDDFIKLLEDPKSFPNQPNAEARKLGYPDAKTQLEYEETTELEEAQLDQEQQKIDKPAPLQPPPPKVQPDVLAPLKTATPGDNTPAPQKPAPKGKPPGKAAKAKAKAK